MRYLLLFIFVLSLGFSGFAQTEPPILFGDGSSDPDQPGEAMQSVTDKRPKPPIFDYKIISVKGDTTYVDTTLTVQKDYKFNYLRKDNFGLLMYSNIGQSYTQLTHDFNKTGSLPEFGARAAHFSYLDVEDIHYYNVPTPWSQLFFKTTFGQGQLLDAFLTSNISPQVNLSIAFKGLHSQGKYRHIMTSQGSFRTTLSYKSKNDRYQIHSHFISQVLEAEQNGGLTDLANSQYASQSGQYSDRAVLDVKYNDADRNLRAKRFFFFQHFDLLKGSGEEANNRLRLGHSFNFTDKEYYFHQGSPTVENYGFSYQNNRLRDLTEFQQVTNNLSAQYQNQILGKLTFKVQHANYNYGYKRKLNLESGTVPNRLKGNIYSVGAEYQKKIGGFELSGEAMLNTVGDFDGNFIRAQASYALDSLNRFEVGILTNSQKPNYNFMLFQSDYKNYNWHHNFKNVQKQRLHVALQAPKILNIAADYTRLHNYTYFDLVKNEDPTMLADTLVKPFQYGGDVSYARLKVQRELKFGKFALDNTLMYQKVLDGSDVLHVPDFITRQSLYYSDYLFNRNLFLQTGLTFNYFTGYKADAYDPILGDFYLQDFEKIKGFSRVDLFINGRIRQTRLFLKFENLTTLIDGNGHYAAPYEPYRDWNIRFGLVWDFFL